MHLTIDTKKDTRMTCTPSCEISCGLGGGTRQVSMRSPTVPNQSKERADVMSAAGKESSKNWLCTGRAKLPLPEGQHRVWTIKHDTNVHSAVQLLFDSVAGGFEHLS